jgi:hypothetical protein
MPSLVFPSSVRDQVLAQHGELRALLAPVLAPATLTHPAPPEMDVAHLSTTARDLCARFRTHLAFEEDELARVFAVLDVWGPERVRALHEGHARQRQELDALLGRFESGGEAEQLALDLRRLATNLLRDMEEEEEGFLRASLMSSDSLPFERH